MKRSERYEPFTLILFLDDGCVSRWVLDNAWAAADDVGDCRDYIAPMMEQYHQAATKAFNITKWPVAQVHDSYANVLEEVTNSDVLDRTYFRYVLTQIKKTREAYEASV